MKKAIVLILLAALVAPIFADDALVLPAGVIRTYIVPVYAFASKEFDNDGKSNDISNFAFAGGTKDKFSVFNLGAAIEYGVTDWISGAVQWTPGWNASSKYETNAAAITNDLNLAGLADLFVGAKMQIVGPKAPVGSDIVRFAVAPGVKIPLGGGDYKKQLENFGAGDAVTLQNVDKQTLGLGVRGYFDYVVNDVFFANLYTQFIYYLGKEKLKDTSLIGYQTAAAMAPLDPSVSWGYDLTFEFEPHFEPMIADGIQLQLTAPLTYTMSPAPKYSDDNGLITGANASSILNVTPSVNFFFMKTVLPLEFKVGYQYPILGKNTQATNAVVIQLKAYAKF